MNKKLKTVRVLGKNNKGLQIRRKRHTNFEDKKTIAKNLLKKSYKELHLRIY